MKKTLVLLIMLLCTSSMAGLMAVYVEVDPGGVPFRVASFGSVNTANHLNRTDVMFCRDDCKDDARALRDSGLADKYWKVDLANQTVVEMSAAEKFIMDAPKRAGEEAAALCVTRRSFIIARRDADFSGLPVAERDQLLKAMMHVMLFCGGGV